jgi:CheY-specific phosphatase CheX
MELLECDRMAEIVGVLTQDVFATMLGVEIAVGEPREESLDSPLRDGVVALVGIGGTWTGSGRLYCSREAACYFASKFLLADYFDVDREVLDVIAEMANMIVGNLKTNLEAEVGPLSLSIPTVIYGQKYLTHCSAARLWTVVPIRCGEHVLDVGFLMSPSPVHEGLMPTPIH